MVVLEHQDYFNCRLSGRADLTILSTLRQKLSKTNKERLKNTCFGQFYDLEKIQFQCQLFLHLLFRQDKDFKSDSIIFHINNCKAEFGPMEFAVITGLKFGPTTEIPDSSKFFNKVFRGKTSLQVKDVQLAFLKSCKIDKGSGDEALKLALLWVLFGILLMKDKTTKKIDMKFVHLVENLDDFNNYPWGRLAYDVLVKNMRKHMGPKSFTRRARKLTTKDKPTLPHIDVHGFAHVLQLWVYEAIPCVASYCATRRSKTSIPRMLRWDASKAFRFDELTQNCFPIFKAGDKMSEREHRLAGSKRARDDVTKRRTKRKEEDRVDSKGSIEDKVKQLKKSYKIMEKAMEEIKAAQAIIMRKLKVHDTVEEEDEGEESDEKDENDESEDNAEEADEAEEEIGKEQGDEEEQEADGEGQDEQEAVDDGEDSDEDDEEDGEDRDESDEGNEEDGEKDEEEAEKEDGEEGDEERDDGQSVGKNVGQEKGKGKCKNDDAIEEFEEQMLGMTDTPMFPGLMYDPLDDQIPTGAEDDLLLWLGENQETGLTVTLSVENILPATAHWFDSIWDDQGWLVSENINAIMNLIILKAQKWPATFNKWWTTVDLTFWAKQMIGHGWTKKMS
ncbi:hypothetical protein ACS0TY_026459 [Phlomoides rotata]